MWIPDLLVVTLVACAVGVAVLVGRRAQRNERERQQRLAISWGEGGGLGDE